MRFTAVLTALGVLLLTSACKPLAAPATPAGTIAPVAPAVASPLRLTTPAIGVYETNRASSFGLVREFGTEVVHPAVVLFFSGWWTPFNRALADDEHAYGSVPLIQIDPDPVKLANVAAGRYDAWLRSYALSVRAFGQPVILSFAHEMNGTWYSWGAGHVTPSVFVAAWRHVVRVFRSEGATNVTWMWTVNAVNAATSLLRQWWPGAEWVDYAGIDGYYYSADDTFASVFGETVAQIRKFTTDPILIGEVAVGPVAGPGKIAGLFAGIRADHLLGLVWFDLAQHKPPYHQDWRLENNPAMLAAFRAAVRSK